jgi:exodeoxyribonuclease III
MRVMTFNCNGVRAAARKGFFDWLKTCEVDIVCLQETKAQEHQLDVEIYYPTGFHCYYFDAQKKGYAGTAIFCRKKPDRISTGLGWPIADEEGRYIQADYGNLSIASIYLPSGSAGPERQARKYVFLDNYMKLLKKQSKSPRQYIISGDWNICHKEIDLKNWKANQKNSGFLPEERAWLDELYDRVGFVDAFRLVNKEAEQYSWWSSRGNARAKNVGWRLDYQVISRNLVDKVKAAEIYTEENFSDHAPVTLEYGFKL